LETSESIHSPNEQNIEELTPEVWWEVSDCEELVGVTYRRWGSLVL